MNASADIDVPAERAFAAVQAVTGFTRADVAGRRRMAGVVRARAMFAWLLRERGVSFARIARALGREESSAICKSRVARDLIAIDKRYAAQCARALAATDNRP